MQEDYLTQGYGSSLGNLARSYQNTKRPGLLTHAGAELVVHACLPCTQEAEVGGSTQVRGQAGLQREVMASPSSIVKPCLKKPESSKDGP